MPLIECPECRRPVSSEAPVCPQCGYPVAEKLKTAGAAGPQANAGPGELLLEVHPSWWGYFWHWFFFFLIIPPIIAAFQRSSTVLRIYRDRIMIERGLLSKCYQDYSPRDIRSIDIDQSFWQRIAGIGNLTLSTSATVEGAEILRSIPDPARVRELIIAQKGS